ncbi:MAG: stress protein [Candidatus Epulonipiscioides saccharophilum]|nr:MAG: stress protein [Epulopiscium sp. AS2M-Bin001]
MAVALKRGQKFSLSTAYPGLSQLVIGLGWDAKKPVTGLFSTAQPFDCDAAAIALSNGKLQRKSDMVYYGNLCHPSGAILHAGDNITGAGDGDDEQIILDFDKLPPHLNSIVLVVNIYEAAIRHQHFGSIENAYIRIFNKTNNREILKYNLTDNYANLNAIIVGELYKEDDEWRFKAVGVGTSELTLTSLSKKYT